ncbi:ABC transporter substrate-binding protein [Nocardioides mangrovi]|uniref:ABC transporter substrate-binding protein n=1 Tax=Nocardioides mangrovi TaxID=2874580 RepID=A0ABS7UBT1_9ACTN|nr:ABC transporter substrate-binding protein [Nocardioides mangrovi]MBZ5738445.1 ABC transporter substrate-binding protein [Nocardioides mangrovi]
MAALAGALTLVTALAACGSSDDTPTAAESADASGVDLAAAGCPSTIVVQTDWNPESEHGHLYEMLGDDAVIDANKKSVTGTLYSQGKSTGVNLEIRAGGPAIGYTGVGQQMYTDDSITMGYITTDDQIANSAKQPTKAFFAPLDQSPIMVMWDPEYYPDVEGVDDLKAALDESGGVWRYFAGSAYQDYLLDAGYVSKSSQDSSYDGTPANFVAAGGKDVQQGFASAEPYIYENEVPSWGKPVKYALISETGWDPYQSEMAVRTADFDKLSPCLKALTPVLQQAEVDFFADPSKANALILKLVQEYNTGWTYSQGVADYSVDTMISDKLVGNGTNDTLGDFDDDRMSTFLETALPIYQKLKSPVKDGLQASDLYTNEFIDPSIGLS